jgi:hypothetical protein
MAKLIFYVPFPRSRTDGDIRTNADEVARCGIGNGLGGVAVVVVFKGEESQNEIGAGDYLCVHGHGGTGKYTTVTNNMGDDMTLSKLTDALNTMGAEKAQACFFFICFSAEKGHIAAKWKADHADQTVYGCTREAQGAVVTTMRGDKVRSSIFHVGNGQLSLVE